MEIPLEITYRDVEKNDALEDLIREKAAKLEEIQEDIVSCRIAVEKVQEHQRSGSPYRIRIVTRIPPNNELVVSREPGEGQVNEQLKTAVNKAFEAMRRQVVKQKEKQQGGIKSHPQEETFIGHVVRLHADDDFGFLRSVEGREIYFHRNSVLHGDFDRLEIGTGVRYVAQDGAQGPQASTVQIVDKPGARVSKAPEPKVDMPEGWQS